MIDLVIDQAGADGLALHYDFPDKDVPEFVQTFAAWLQDEHGISPTDEMRVAMYAHAANGGIKIDKEQCDILCDEIHRVKEGGKMADVKPEVKALCEELSGFKYEDCFAHNNVGFQDGSVIPAE